MLIKENQNFKKVLYTIVVAILLLCTLPLVASASISYDSYLKVITVQDEPGVNITEIYNSIGDNAVIAPLGNKIWLVNACIYSKNSTVYINDTDVLELRITGKADKSKLLYGYKETDQFRIYNVTITGWDATSNKATTVGGIVLHNSEFHDVAIKHSTAIQIFKSSIGDISNITIENSRDFWIENLKNKKIHDIYVQNGVATSAGALYILNSDSLEVYNITVNHTLRSGIQCTNISDSEFYNIRVSHAGSHLTPQTGYHGIVLNRGSNNYLHDSYINDTGWSSLCPTGGETGSIIRNVSIYNSGHNGLDIHPASNILVENVSIYDSVSNNILITTGDGSVGPAENVTIKDVCLTNGGALIGGKANNLTFNNVTIGGGAISAFGSHSLKIINTTITTPPGYVEFDNYITFTEVDSDGKIYNGYIIDSKFYRLNSYIANNSRVINSYYEMLYGKDDLTIYYYPDFLVKDYSKTPICNSEILIINNVDSLIKSVNGYGDEITNFSTDATGRTNLPNKNRLKSPAIAIERYIKSDSKPKCFSHTAIITTPDNRTISLSGITPDSSWYREDPNIPTYTITAIIPDNSTGPHITGFAPSEENPFTPGEKKIFRVWTDEPLTTMEWYIDGGVEPVYAGDMNYIWTAEKGGHTISFIGSNANGTVNESWEIMGGYGALPAPIIEFFPTDTVLTRKTGESDTFSVNSDQPLTTNWSVNGKLIQNDTTSITQSWNTSGTYEVTVNGFSGEEEILNTWMVNVTDSVKSQDTSNVTVTPEYQIVIPNQSFAIDVEIDPSTTINGAQFDLLFDSSMVRVDSVAEGNLFKQEGAITHFINGIINNTTGTVTYVYGSVLESNVSSPGVFATVTLTAGSNTGITELNLSNVIVSDSNSKAAPTTINDATILIDTAPVLNSIGSKSVSETNSMSFMVGASDADGDSLIYSATDLPEGARFDPESGMFSWTPSRGQAGVYTATFEVSDGYLNDSENVSITVNPANNIPVIDSFRPEDGAIYNEKDKINILVNASDLDGQFLYYVIKINGITYSTEPSYIWKTNYSSSGEHTVEVTVSDGTDQVTEQHTLYIKDYHPSWDVNEDDVVNILDISNVSQKYGMTTTEPYPRWDVNQDGVVNIQDLSIVGYYFGEEMK